MAQADKILIASLLAAAAGAASAQTSSVTVYGTIDQYLNYMHSSSGTSLKTLNDGAFLRSRLGFRGTEDLGNGYFAKFQLEHGLSADTGTQADTTRFFDRQAWVGLGNVEYGEVRFGRQNTAIFYRGDYIDFTSRTLGSVVNAFGVPSRYDNDISYLSPRLAGVMVEGHFALGETGGLRDRAIYQAAVDYNAGPFRVGYAGLRAKAAAGAVQSDSVRYDNLYANYDYGAGKVYLVAIRSNNNTSAGAGATLINNGAAIVGNVGGTLAGTNPDVKRYYNIVQVSADYAVSPALRVGGLWGRIRDTSGSGRNADGGALGAYYALSKRTTLIAEVDTLRNDTNGGFRLAGSAGLSPNFATANDVNGRSIRGVHMGVLHRF